MASLDKHISSNNFFHDFNNIKRLAESAQFKTSFWGSRLIEVQGYSGSVPIDHIANALLDYSNRCCKLGNFSLDQRKNGIKAIGYLDCLYFKSILEIKEPNFIKRFFILIRDFFNTNYTTKFIHKVRVNFLCFSNDGFMQVFPNEINVASTNKNIKHPELATSTETAFGIRYLPKPVHFRATGNTQDHNN